MKCYIDTGQHIFAIMDFQMSDCIFCKNCNNKIGFFLKTGVNPGRIMRCKFCGEKFKTSWLGWIFLFLYPLFYIFFMVAGFYIFNKGGFYELVIYFILANISGIFVPAIIYYFFVPIIFIETDS